MSLTLTRRILVRRIGIAVAAVLILAQGADVPRVAAQGPPPVRVGFSSAMTGPSAITGEGVDAPSRMPPRLRRSKRA